MCDYRPTDGRPMEFSEEWPSDDEAAAAEQEMEYRLERNQND